MAAFWRACCPSLTLANKEVSENLAEVGVVWLVVKAQRTAVLEVGAELEREAFAKELNGGGHLLFADFLILLLLCRCFQALHLRLKCLNLFLCSQEACSCQHAWVVLATALSVWNVGRDTGCVAFKVLSLAVVEKICWAGRTCHGREPRRK